MNAEGIVKVFLSRSKFQGHADALHDLGRVCAAHVNAENSAGRLLDDHLYHRLFVTAGQPMFHRTELALVDFDVRSEFLSRPVFRQSDRRQFRLAEYRGRDKVIINGFGRFPEQEIGDEVSARLGTGSLGLTVDSRSE